VCESLRERVERWLCKTDRR